MYTWSRVLAAISKKCDPKVLVAEQVVWLDAACYRPHTLIWWRRLWIWLRHSSIGIATHWHTWALLHTFRIFFLSTPGCIHSHFVIPSVLSEAKMSFKTLPFPTKSYWLSNSLSSLCWSLSKVQIWGLRVSTGVQKINHRRCGLEVDVHPCVSFHIFDIFVLSDNGAIQWILLHSVPQIGWTGNENSKCGEFKGDKLGRLCMLSISASSASVTTSLPASKSASALPNVPMSTTNAGSDIQKWKPKLLKLDAAHTWSLSYLPTAVFASCSISLLSPPHPPAWLAALVKMAFLCVY